MRNIAIADMTLEEATKSKNISLSFKEKIEIARHLENLRADVIETPHIININTDMLLVRTIASFVKRSTLAISCGMTEESVEAAWKAVSGAAKPRLVVALPMSPVQMEYVCHKKAPKMVELISQLVKKCVSYGVETEFRAVDATRAEEDVLAAAINAAIDAGASVITICDDDASMMPDKFAAFVANIIETVPNIKNVKIGVGCSNKYNMSVAASLMAVGVGAGEIKVSATGTLTGIENVGQIVRNNGDSMGITTNLKYTEISRTAKQIDWIVNAKKNDNSPFDSVVSDIGHGINLTADDTITTVIDSVKKLGYDLSDEDNAKVYEAFKRVAIKKTVTSKELDAIVASTALQVPPTFKLVSYVINSGNVITASAHITLEKNGNAIEGICLGDGPIDAAFLAVEQIIGHHYELDDFQIQSVTEGRGAMGSAIVKLRRGGRVYSGRGISTDIIGASIRAYISALNKITYEEA